MANIIDLDPEEFEYENCGLISSLYLQAGLDPTLITLKETLQCLEKLNLTPITINVERTRPKETLGTGKVYALNVSIVCCKDNNPGELVAFAENFAKGRNWRGELYTTSPAEEFWEIFFDEIDKLSKNAIEGMTCQFYNALTETAQNSVFIAIDPELFPKVLAEIGFFEKETENYIFNFVNHIINRKSDELFYESCAIPFPSFCKLKKNRPLASCVVFSNMTLSSSSGFIPNTIMIPDRHTYQMFTLFSPFPNFEDWYFRQWHYTIPEIEGIYRKIWIDTYLSEGDIQERDSDEFALTQNLFEFTPEEKLLLEISN